MTNSGLPGRRAMAAGLLLGLLSACQLTPPASTPIEPAESPGAPAHSSGPASFFIDTFDGHTLDTERWSVFEQTGLVTVRDGAVELLNMQREPNFPYMVTRSSIIPASGPFAFEVVYQFRSAGEAVSMCLDYLPAETPAVEPLTVPLVRLEKTYTGAKLIVDLPGDDMVVDAAAAVTTGQWHRMRVTFDGEKRYQVLIDGQSLAAFETTRRPEKFWIGKFPPHQEVRAVWPRLAIDEVRVEQ